MPNMEVGPQEGSPFTLLHKEGKSTRFSLRFTIVKNDITWEYYNCSSLQHTKKYYNYKENDNCSSLQQNTLKKWLGSFFYRIQPLNDDADAWNST